MMDVPLEEGNLLLRTLTLSALALTLLFALAPVAGGKNSSAPYSTDYNAWRSFGTWSTTGAGTSVTADGRLTLGLGTQTGSDTAGAYYGGNFYNAGTYTVGEATSTWQTPDTPYTEAIASWNADTPPGTWVETLIRARFGTRETKWYNLGVWAADIGTVKRHSVRLQGDTDGYVGVDTLVLNGKKAPPADSYQIKLRLFTTNAASPTVRYLSVATSTAAPGTAAHAPSSGMAAGVLLNVPQHSQMVYPDGGNVWCSPTSLSMVLASYGAFDPAWSIELRVRDTVGGVYDWIYDGHGNWPFNTAWAATKTTASGTSLEGSIARFTSLNQVEDWVAAGVPVIFSFAWTKGSLTGSAIPSSDGHIAVIVGFDAAGNPIVNDPAAASNEAVQRTYDRTELETVWLEASGGTVYLVYPRGTTGLPALG